MSKFDKYLEEIKKPTKQSEIKTKYDRKIINKERHEFIELIQDCIKGEIAFLDKKTLSREDVKDAVDNVLADLISTFGSYDKILKHARSYYSRNIKRVIDLKDEIEDEIRYELGDLTQE